MSDHPINPLVLIGVGSSFCLSALSCHFYRVKNEELRKLKEIPIFKPDQHLLDLLKASPRKRFPYIAVQGLVQPDGEPLASEFVPRRFGVVQKISEEEHWEYWNSLTKTWDSRSTNRKQTNHTVPFSLVALGGHTTPGGHDGVGDVYVKVQNPLEATGLDLDRVHRLRHAAEGGVSDAILEDLSGERVVAKAESEELLRVGATVTGFGELVLEADAGAGAGGRVMRLQAPQDGRPFILAPTDYKSYVAWHDSSASLWKMLAVACGAVGTTVLAGTIYDFLKKLYRP
ncbi:mitochondrial ubiquitin ligase activator of nfkb 1-A-like [Gadus morhua]|uniref:RING-type E3 ubiquitin transferase n=1 Tax=Gadus morhua TaxID=8049 RepID=A0A8C4ZJT4_GADMO|nr:mitochondrial ubiquitin ligase activator of nfkb 1-A-like [Gadus morhua]XP_030220223.1 mitochondrial ubiquitin ligase activator of nfkb 1-A-like [Gadus morhua]